jgi:hypothetical protein
MKKMPLLAAALFAAVAYFSGQYNKHERPVPPPVAEVGAERAAEPTRDGSAGLEQRAHAVAARVAEAFAKRESKVHVMGGAVVSKVLSDDNDGSRHQRFLIKLASGSTLLVAHNIDLAPRVESIQAGDPIEFSGVYEWNAKGGVVHWTHRDPSGRHAAGWIKHDGHTYQ